MISRKPFVFVTLGSYGDVLPMLSIAQRLSQLNHKVIFISNGHFKSLFEDLRIEFIQISSSEKYEDLIKTVNVNNTYELSLALVKYLLLDPVKPIFELLDNISNRGNIILVANGTNLGARLYHDKTGCDFVSAYFSPSVIPSAQFSPRLFKYHLAKLLPLSLRKIGFKLFNSVVNFLLLKKVNSLRFKFGLTRSTNLLDLFHSPQSILGLYSQKFLGVTPQDWPKQFQTVGFPIFRNNLDISEVLENFLSRGEKPILVCRGTPNLRVDKFMETMSAAILSLNQRAILVSGHFSSSAVSKHPDIFQANFLPYDRVISRCKAVVHHGGIGTSAQCLRAGVPQLIAPWGVDQWDNSMRLQDLGVALEINERELSTEKIRYKLSKLLSDDQIDRNSQRMSNCEYDYQGSERAVEYLLNFCGDRRAGKG